MRTRHDEALRILALARHLPRAVALALKGIAARSVHQPAAGRAARPTTRRSIRRAWCRRWSSTTARRCSSRWRSSSTSKRPTRSRRCCRGPARTRPRARPRADRRGDGHPLVVPRVRNYLESEMHQDEAARNAGRALDARRSKRSKRIWRGDGDRPLLPRRSPTIADICLASQVSARSSSSRHADVPTVSAIFGECMKIDAFDRTQPLKQPDAPKHRRIDNRAKEETMAFNRRKFIQATGPARRIGAGFPAIVRAQSEPIRLGLLTVKTGPLASGGIDMERALVHVPARAQQHASPGARSSCSSPTPPASPAHGAHQDAGTGREGPACTC